MPLTDCLNLAENIPLGKNVPPGPDTAGVEGEASNARSHLRRIAGASILWEYLASAKGCFKNGSRLTAAGDAERGLKPTGCVTLSKSPHLSVCCSTLREWGHLCH